MLTELIAYEREGELLMNPHKTHDKAALQLQINGLPIFFQLQNYMSLLMKDQRKLQKGFNHWKVVKLARYETPQGAAFNPLETVKVTRSEKAARQSHRTLKLLHHLLFKVPLRLHNAELEIQLHYDIFTMYLMPYILRHFYHVFNT